MTSPPSLRAVNRGLADTVTDLDAAIASVVARDKTVRADVDKPRLAGTLAMEMAHPEGARHRHRRRRRRPPRTRHRAHREEPRPAAGAGAVRDLHARMPAAARSERVTSLAR